MLFRFNVKHLDSIAHLLKPKTSGSNISPFSVKNLPKSNYKIPDDDLLPYKKITANVPSEQALSLAHIIKKFADTDKTIKQQLKESNMKPKEFYHSTGKWNEFLEYLKKQLENI